MELTDQLLSEVEGAPDQSTPVVFHLSTWVVEWRPLVSWLVEELYKRHGVPRRLAQMWVDADQVIPLLDGLDEVAAEHRDACAAAINTAVSPGGHPAGPRPAARAERAAGSGGPVMAPLFPLGRVLATPGAIALMEAARIDSAELLERHQVR